MCESNASFGINKSNEHPGINEASRNAWVVGISTSHPGQKYYFNTITGISLWNISIEEMERSQQYMKSNGSQSQYVNCPEPKEPPPNRRILGKHSTQCSQLLNRQINNGFSRHLSGITSETSSNSVNQLSLHNRLCAHPECLLPLNISGLRSPVNSHLAPPSLDTSCCNNNSNNLLGRKRSFNTGDPEVTVQDSRCQDHRHNPYQYGNESECPDTDRSIEGLDVSALKMLAKSDNIEHKWYIVADVSVYLDSIHFLKTVLYADQHCCLMVPRSVMIELENVTKDTQLRTKAYCAIYFIYKIVDCGIAVIDEDVLETNQDKSDKEHVIHCCAKLNKHNYYVVLISNDLDLKKYVRYKINIPSFTIKELKEYLCKTNIPLSSPKQVLLIPHKNKNIGSDNTNLIQNACMSKINAVLKKNQHTQTSLVFIEKTTQIDSEHITKRSVEVQTALSLSQLEAMESIYKNQNNDYSNEREKSFGYCHSCKQPTGNTNFCPRKHVKLRRKKVENYPALTNLMSEPQSALVETVDESSRTDSNTPNTVFKSLWGKSETNAENVSNNFHEISMKTGEIFNQNQNNTCNSKKIKSRNNNVQKYQEKIHSKIKIDIKHNQKLVSSSSSLNKNVLFENKNVMFEITNTAMEQNLKVKCDEWVSRFVQIMEEALTQVLRKDASLYLPPPWNMYEATMCIAQKYKEDPDVADACTKLLNVLNCISASKGNSNVNISPTKFMELYSYGVYLIDVLQGILNTSEDLQIAAESLSKLLGDIQNPELEHMEHSTIESLEDISREDHTLDEGECTSNNINTILGDRQNFSVDSINLPNNVEDLNEDSRAITEDMEMLSNRSEKSKSSLACTEWSNSNTQTEDTIIENLEQSKAANVQCNNSVACAQISGGSKKSTPVSSPSSYNLRSVQRKTFSTTTDEKSCSEVTCSVFNSLDGANNINNEPKIVRSFIMCSEFEERIRNHEIQNEYDEFDYGNEDMEIDYNYDDDCSSGNRKLDIDEFSEYNRNGDILSQPLECEAEQNKSVIKISFKCFIKKIAQEIKDISSMVYEFGKKCCEESSSLSDFNEKSEVREKAEQAYLYVDKLCTSLTSILCRNKDFNYNLEAALRNTEFGNLSVDEDQMNIYGSFIERCLDQAHGLKVLLEEIVSSILK